jgi:hypothetical protein
MRRSAAALGVLLCGCAAEPVYDGWAGDGGDPDTTSSGDDASLDEVTFPAEVACGETATGSVVMRNDGEADWSGGQVVQLGVVANSELALGDGATTGVWLPQGVQVAPGETHRFDLLLVAPELPGTRHLRLRMMRNYAPFGDAVELPVTIACGGTTTSPYDVRATSIAAPSRLPCSGPGAVAITMRNDGTEAWDAAEVTLVSASDPATPLALAPGTTVAPGGTHTFTYTLRAPAAAGTYAADWRMDRAGTGAFGGAAAVRVTVSCPTDGVSGSVTLHPTNPRYFVDGATGEPVLITGFGALVPSDRSYDYVAGIAGLAANGSRYARVWHLLPWAQENAIWPWARSGTGGAYLGGNKYDLNTWNPEYWTRLRHALQLADAAGIVAEIHLFDRCGMSPAAWTRWANNPWASDNNINGVETPPGSEDGTPEFYEWQTRPTLRQYQESYIRKMIDETIEFDNVVYEEENEHWQYNDRIWAEHVAQVVRDHMGAHYPTAARVISYSSLIGDLETLYDSSLINVINKHFGGGAVGDMDTIAAYIGERWQYGKAINIDEMANGVQSYDALRRITWTIVTSGGHFHIEDAAPSARAADVGSNQRAFLARSGWDFVAAAPDHGRLVGGGGGTCMANPGTEVVCYLRSGGAFGLDLEAAPLGYAVTYWNPRTGGFVGDAVLPHGGGVLSLQTPDGSDWVVRVVAVGS